MKPTAAPTSAKSDQQKDRPQAVFFMQFRAFRKHPTAPINLLRTIRATAVTHPSPPKSIQQRFPPAQKNSAPKFGALQNIQS
jgi:hypothetical protein